MSAKTVPILAAGAMLVAAVSPAAAAPGFVCELYATTAVWQQYSNVKRHCGFSGPAWHTWWDAHYSWCLLQSSRRVNRESNIRGDYLAGCRM